MYFYISPFSKVLNVFLKLMAVMIFKNCLVNLSHTKSSTKRIFLSLLAKLFGLWMAFPQRTGYLDVCMACVCCTTQWMLDVNKIFEKWIDLMFVCMDLIFLTFSHLTFTHLLYLNLTICAISWEVGVVHGRNEKRFQIILSVYMSWKMWIYYVHGRCSTYSQSACSSMLD